MYHVKDNAGQRVGETDDYDSAWLTAWVIGGVIQVGVDVIRPVVAAYC